MPRSALCERGERIVIRRVGQAESDHAACIRPERFADCDALLGARREPAHVAVLAGGEKLGQPCARLGAEFGAAEADRVEAEGQRAVADQWLWISGVAFHLATSSGSRNGI